MARAIGRLTALKVEKAKQPGMYCDGGGLYLRVTPEGAKNWVLRYMLDSRPRWMGLGPLALYSLQEARARALDARRKRHEGIDPIEARRAERARQRLDAARAVTFQQCAESYIASHGAGWRNAKHKYQWPATLSTYAYPVIGVLPVQTVDTGLVLKMLERIWTVKPETAGRVRQRVESILDFAKVRGYRDGENPARWRGHLDKLLPARSRVRGVEHHAALPYTELPAFLASLRKREAVSARALEFLIVTAGRTGEVIGAHWSEISLLDKTWTVPATRMKAHREHRVPLSPRALVILQEMHKARDGHDGFVFPGPRPGKPLSNVAFLRLLRRMGLRDLTVHGFRATFKTWASERTSFQNEIVEASLAHTIGGKVEQAYLRGDMFDKRRRLMQQWATFCTTAPAQGNVTPLRRKI
jgi:integrase